MAIADVTAMDAKLGDSVFVWYRHVWRKIRLCFLTSKHVSEADS